MNAAVESGASAGTGVAKRWMIGGLLAGFLAWQAADAIWATTREWAVPRIGARFGLTQDDRLPTFMGRWDAMRRRLNELPAFSYVLYVGRDKDLFLALRQFLYPRLVLEMNEARGWLRTGRIQAERRRFLLDLTDSGPGVVQLPTVEHDRGDGWDLYEIVGGK